MIEIKNSALRTGDLEGAAQKISNAKKFNPWTAMRIFKIVEQLMERKEYLQEKFIDLAKEHAQLDDNGNFKPQKDHFGKIKPNTFITKDKPAWERAVAELGEKTFQIKGEKFPMETLNGLELSPIEIAALEPLISDLEKGESDGKEESKKESF